MGSARATEIFDSAVDVALEFIPTQDLTEPVIKAVVERMYTGVDWGDWDTQDESDYFHYLVDIMHERGELDYDWYAEYKAERETSAPNDFTH